MITSLVLLNLVGGEAVDDLRLLEADDGFCRVLEAANRRRQSRGAAGAVRKRWRKGRQRSVPSPSAVFRYLTGFHAEVEEARREPGREELYKESTLLEQAALGASHAVLSDHNGRLNIAAAVSYAQNELNPAAVITDKRSCTFFGLICSHRQIGKIANDTNQATQGGYAQYRSNYYGPGSTTIAFNSITCGGNNPVNGVAALGCGPSAFIGLIGEKYENHNIAVAGRCMNPATNSRCTTRQTYGDFTRWMVAEIGVNGRPRIANYMGTCNIGNNEGLTLLSGFTTGIQNFLRDTNTNLTLKWRAGIGGATGWNQNAAANIIHRQVGIRENPVIATYWPTATTAHYAPISEYDIFWSAGISIMIRTTDGNNTWYTLGGTWSGQEGVYYLE